MCIIEHPKQRTETREEQKAGIIHPLLRRVAAPRFRGPQMRIAMADAIMKNPEHDISARLIKLARKHQL